MTTPAALASSQPEKSVFGRPSRGVFSLAVYCVSHFTIDLYSAALGVLQPLLIAALALTLTQAGLLGGLLSFSSSVTQPLYGYLSDRFHSRLFSALAPAIAGIFISGLGLATSYPMLLFFVLLGGAGIASFHPQAAGNATVEIRRNRGQAMAIFICSGTVGLAAGPAVYAWLTARGGLHSAIWAAIPGIVVTLAMLVWMPQPRRNSSNSLDWTPLLAVWKPMTLLYLMVFLRSIVQVTFTQFLPLYLEKQRGYTHAAASLSLSVYLIGGALGGIAGGRLADRFGGRAVIIASMLGSFPCLALFVFGSGVASALGLFIGGLFLLFTIPVNVWMAQQLAPANTGTVSALMMGFGWGAAGMIFIPLTGFIAQHTSLQTAFAGLTLVPLIGFFFALRIPKMETV